MNTIELTREIVSEVNKKVKRTYWTNDEIDKLFGKRSAEEIINNGTTCYMNPCLDLTLVSSAIMHSSNIPHSFVIEEHLSTEEFPFNRLHFVLEFKENNKIYSLNYKRCNEVYISEGNYSGRKDIPLAKIIRLPGKIINPKKKIFESMGYNSLEELTKIEFKDYSLEKNIGRLKMDNFKERFEKYNKIFGEELNLIITL
jgi:hypothetical protein